MRHKGSVFGRLSLLITLCRRVKHVTSPAALGRLQARFRDSRQSGPKALQERANLATIFPAAHRDTRIYTYTSALLSTSCPHLQHYTEKHLERATPACQSHGLKPPDHWCRWMAMDNQQDTRDGERDWWKGRGAASLFTCCSSAPQRSM